MSSTLSVRDFIAWGRGICLDGLIFPLLTPNIRSWANDFINLCTIGWQFLSDPALFLFFHLVSCSLNSFANVNSSPVYIWAPRRLACIVLFFQKKGCYVFDYMKWVKLARTMKTLVVSNKSSKKRTSPNSAWRFCLVCFFVDNLISSTTKDVRQAWYK